MKAQVSSILFYDIMVEQTIVIKSWSLVIPVYRVDRTTSIIVITQDFST